MKIYSFLFATALLAGCSQAPSNTDAANAPAAEDMAMSDAEHAKMASETPSMPVEKTAVMASATGTVEAVDAAGGKITIAHGPVDALKWPAMRMGFKATPEQIASVQLGQKVQFKFESKGMQATITRISPMD